MRTKRPTVSFYRETAPGKLDRLKEQATIRLSELFRGKGFTQSDTAQALGISQPRLSDALRGKYEKFTLDRLYEMLFAFGDTVKVEFEPLPSKSGGGYIAREPSECRRSVEHYTRAIEEEPGNARAHARRGSAYLELRERDKAIADYTRAIELEPDRSGYYVNRIVCYKIAGQFHTALFECDRFEQLFPDYGINQNRSLILWKMGRLEEALECCNKAVLESPERPGPYSNRAELLLEMGRGTEAVRDYENALKCDPENQSYAEKIAELKVAHTP